ncbi:MAG TPA: pyruvate kinase [Pantanalinema sp.]
MEARKSTKIVATLGPASSNDEVVRRLIEAGVDVFRLNFSHGTHETHLANIERVRRIAKEMGRHIALLQDIQGPKIRVGEIKGGQVTLIPGQTFILTTQPLEGNEQMASVSYERLTEDIEPGKRILLDDGLLELQVVEVKPEMLVTRVMVGGPLKPRKGVNFPGSPLKISVLTDKDRRDLAFGAQHGVDLVAASFVQQASDVLEVKDCLAKNGVRTPVIAKIERREAVQALAEIVAVADGVMVARGDLGVEIPVEDVPLVQKQIIRMCNLEGKPVITATQMLDSMIHNPRPTRAEASDVANAILDGTDAVMLSNETAAGSYPLEAVETMARIALQVERNVRPTERPELEEDYARPVQDAIAHAATRMVPELNASAIITATYSGSSARHVSKYRPNCPIIAASCNEEVCRQMALVWGVVPMHIAENDNIESLFTEAVDCAKGMAILAPGDLAIMVAGVPMGEAGTTNSIKVEVITSIITRGMGLGQRPISGIARVASTPREAMSKLEPGDILVTHQTDAEWTPAMERANGTVVHAGGLTSHAAIVSLELGKPVILGTEDLGKIHDGMVITLDPVRGLVLSGQVKI